MLKNEDFTKKEIRDKFYELFGGDNPDRLLSL